MNRQTWNAGDLVQVTWHENLGEVTKHGSYLVLVLGAKQMKYRQTYPLTAEWERKKEMVYRVLKFRDGIWRIITMKLSDFTSVRGDVTCTNQLVQRISCGGSDG